MLAVKLWGGLGNQMFQYAFAKRLEADSKEKVFFYTLPPGQVLLSPLLNFNVNIDPCPDDVIRKGYHLPTRGYTYSLERKLVQKFPLVNRALYVEDSLDYHPEFPAGARLFDGYFQSWKYSDALSEQIREDLRPKEKILLRLPPYPDGMGHPRSVSVHIRRGDYLRSRNRKIFAIPGEGYYRLAIETIRKQIPDPLFFLFSDDPEWLKHNLHLFRGLDCILPETTGAPDSSIADFIFMSRCRHQIIANSTFSWWAAWLNPNPEKIVIAPRSWYNGALNLQTNDLIPDSWRRV